MDDEFKLYGDDTMRHLEALASRPDAEVRYKLALVYALKDFRRELRATKGEIIARIGRAEKTIIGPGKVAHIVKSEMKDDQRVGKLETDIKRLWWFVGILTVAIIGLAIAKALK
jgi:hypothetical protein